MKFIQTVTIEPYVSEDGFRNVTYGTAATVSCNYQEMQEVPQTGDNLITSAWLALPTGTSIDYNSRVTLNDGTQPKVKSIEQIRSFAQNKVVYIRVILGFPINEGEP